MLRVVHLILLCLALGLTLSNVVAADLFGKQRYTLLLSMLSGTLPISFLQLITYGDLLLPNESVLPTLNAALSTWIGQVIAFQMCLVMGAVCSLVLRAYRIAFGLLLLAALATAWRGHVIAAEGLSLIGLAAVLHVALAVLWIAGLVALFIQSLSRMTEVSISRWSSQLQQFSRFAAPGMLLLLASGVWLAIRMVGSGAGLVATPYGIALIVKLAIISLALLCALQLRRWLASEEKIFSHKIRQWLSKELMLALLVVVLAGLIASTVPAAHDQITWPFAFRIAPTAAVLQKGNDALLSVSLSMLALIVASLIGCRLYQRNRWYGVAGAVTVALISAGWGVRALSVDAFPTTYLHSPVPYDATSVIAGSNSYQQWCVTCHGSTGRGDGPLASGMRVRPANLNEPHVQWHTHGDVYWWLSHGIPQSGMPGYATHLSEDERWQLLNFLSAMSMGYEARPLSTAVADNNPWLPEIDFTYTASGVASSLSHWRQLQRPVLLAFLNKKIHYERLSALNTQLISKVVQPIVVLGNDSSEQWAPSGWASFMDTRGETTQVWSHYRRTLADPDFDDARTDISGMLFLIDRFGFVRARWTTDDDLPSAEVLIAQINRLAREPEIRPLNIHQGRE